jgi:C1A family cysteine protease
MPFRSDRRIYAWVPDVPDARDRVYRAPRAVKVPDRVDLRERMSPVPVEDQGELGSCTANAIVASMEFLRAEGGEPHVDLSRLFIYYNERLAEGTVREDAGAQIRTGIKSVVKTGVCLESTWPYEPARFTRRPVKKCYLEAKVHRAATYERIPSIFAMMHALHRGFPVVFGFSVYESFESDEVAATGMAPFPDIRHERSLGGHAVVAVGYDKETRIGERVGAVICRNSWSSAWGDGGYFYLPLDYVKDYNYADDFWAITSLAAPGGDAAR